MRQDFSGASYERARRAFVHKIALEPFTHPAAVGPVIHSADAHQFGIGIPRRRGGPIDRVEHTTGLA